MYEELVERLRERAAWINFPHHGEEYPTEDAKLMMDAADAIEELADWLVMNGDGSDYQTWLDWLKQEAE